MLFESFRRSRGQFSKVNKTLGEHFMGVKIRMNLFYSKNEILF